MKAIVIGGSGFIGGHLAELLLAKGYETTIADVKQPEGFEWKGNFIKTDVGKIEDIDLVVSEFKPDVIFDCSGVLGTAETFGRIHDAIDINIKGVINALDVAKKYSVPFIYCSLTNKWLNPYTITKRAATKFCLMYAKEYGMKVAVVRGLNAYGARQHWKKVRKIAPTFITRALDNEDIVLNGTGNQVVDMVHAKDLSEIMIRVFEKGNCWGKAIDGGTGIPVTVREVAELVIKLTGSQSKLVNQPMRMGEPENSVTLADPAPACQLLGFRPQVDLEEGMKEAIEWYRENYKTFDP